jgi:hypothetical protein
VASFTSQAAQPDVGRRSDGREHGGARWEFSSPWSTFVGARELSTTTPPFLLPEMTFCGASRSRTREKDFSPAHQFAHNNKRWTRLLLSIHHSGARKTNLSPKKEALTSACSRTNE